MTDSELLSRFQSLTQAIDLVKLDQQIQSLQDQLQDQSIWKDQSQLIKLNRRLSYLNKLSERLTLLQKDIEDIDQLQQLLMAEKPSSDIIQELREHLQKSET
jgi:protein subunit release factor A